MFLFKFRLKCAPDNGPRKCFLTDAPRPLPASAPHATVLHNSFNHFLNIFFYCLWAVMYIEVVH